MKARRSLLLRIEMYTLFYNNNDDNGDNNNNNNNINIVTCIARHRHDKHLA
jgi:hypothetical protein